MRTIVCETLVRLAGDPNFVFITGDLGFQALEPLQAALGPRFINAGVAEQNMVGVAAGLAREGFSAWAYSIAPFIYARPYEQIRNDVCLHGLPVKLVGNGGGYAYGVMGSTHHAIEDYGALLALRGMQAFVPAFAEDVPEAVHAMNGLAGPSYLRLGRTEKPAGYELPPYAPWRRLLSGPGPAVVVVGPLAGSYLQPLTELPGDRRPNFWVVTELPITQSTIPEAFLSDLRESGALLVVEEHVAHGGAGQMLAHVLLSLGLAPRRFVHRPALGYPSGLYGSQQYHRTESGLDPQSILHDIEQLCRNFPRT
ncbi:MAG: transketolase family protein [Capsulimonadaceae bacterium]